MHLMSGRTAFDIAHRLSTIRQSDQVLVVYNGRIIERGTQESLSRKGFYHNQYGSQYRQVQYSLRNGDRV